MHSAGPNRTTKARSNMSNVGPRFSWTKQAVDVIRGALTLAMLLALLLIAARPAPAQTETVLYSFTGGSNGTQSSLTSDGKGNFYGTTYSGGRLGYGTVFELSPKGHGGWHESALHSFNGGKPGAYPLSSVVFMGQ
jgi:uncharacterized repeat protein (TIGR03803 family)